MDTWERTLCRLHFSGYRKFLVLVLLTFTFLVISNTVSAKKVTQKFNHDKTGYTLEGIHVYADCESCHARGIFKGTPRTCQGCHAQAGRITATRKPINHISSSADCGQCHTSTAWKPAKIDHSKITDSCNSCHNGTTATGKSKNHIATSSQCNVCHSSRAWVPANFNHSTITDGCIKCHNGTTAIGKTKGKHPPSSNSCESCHTINSFSFNHKNVRGDCFSCHNGTTSGGKKSARHVVSDNRCEVCHKNNRAWTFTHGSGITGCTNCHSGQTKGKQKGAKHIVTVASCESCHKSTSTWTFDHSNVKSGCTNCHRGQTAGRKINPATHVKVAPTVDCAVCHGSNRSWTVNVVVNHTSFTGACSGCHNKNATHMPTSNSCGGCHKTTKGGFLKANTNVDHRQITVSCQTCHTGKYATSKKSTTHVATTNACANCHKSTAQGGWPTNIKMDHSQLVGAGACATCHKTGGVGTPKPQVHMNTTLACDICHDKTTTWAIRSITYTHQAGLTQGWFKHGSLTSCIDCHASNGLVQWETGLYKKSCAGCHARQYEPENDHLPPITSIEANKHCGGTVPGGTGCHGRNRGF